MQITSIINSCTSQKAVYSVENCAPKSILCHNHIVLVSRDSTCIVKAMSQLMPNDQTDCTILEITETV